MIGGGSEVARDSQPESREPARFNSSAQPEPSVAADESGAEPPNWPDESVESAFLAEARERGEVVAPAKPKEEVAEEADPKSLPKLDELVQRIPADVREALDDLFRARFTTVKRVPKKALK